MTASKIKPEKRKYDVYFTNKTQITKVVPHRLCLFDLIFTRSEYDFTQIISCGITTIITHLTRFEITL